MVPSLDRLSWSLADLIAIVAALRRRGVGFKSLHEALDTTIPGGRLVFHVFAALAEFIRELIAEGTREGLDAAPAAACASADRRPCCGLCPASGDVPAATQSGVDQIVSAEVRNLAASQQSIIAAGGSVRSNREKSGNRCPFTGSLSDTPTLPGV